MKTYKIKLNYEIEVEADNEEEALIKFEENVEDYQSSLATFVSDNLEINEIKIQNVIDLAHNLK